jgi:hypothetical protein
MPPCHATGAAPMLNVITQLSMDSRLRGNDVHEQTLNSGKAFDVRRVPPGFANRGKSHTCRPVRRAQVGRARVGRMLSRSARGLTVQIDVR